MTAMNLVRSPFTDEIAGRLRLAAIGETVTYQALKDALGFDVRDKMGPLRSARDSLEKKDRIVFRVLKKVGLERLDDAGKVDRMDGYRRKVRNTAIRGIRVGEAVENFDALPNDLKVQHNTTRAILGVIRHATDRQQIRKLSAVVAAQPSFELPLAKTLEAFKK